MITRHQIVAILVLLAVVASFGSVYQFYFKKRLEAYSNDEAIRDQLLQKAKALETAFKGTEPRAMVDAWRGAVVPWRMALESRSRWFTLGVEGERTEIVVPADKFPKFYYQEELPKIFTELQRHALAKGCPIPANTFGVPDPALGAVSVSKENVEKWLRQATLGCSITRMIIDSKVQAINALELWPPRPAEFGGVIEWQTVGLALTMTLDNFVAFVDKLRRENRYYHINALRIRNPRLRYPPGYGAGGPPLEIEMVLTMAKFVPESSALMTAEGGEATPGPGLAMGAARPPTVMAGGRQISSPQQLLERLREGGTEVDEDTGETRRRIGARAESPVVAPVEEKKPNIFVRFFNWYLNR